jgi:isopentenyl diphosphate isomerase/L-lactate dehydrogenase-like FMN-dependent dehydrogenase
MARRHVQITSRRRLLRYIAASPLFAGSVPSFAQQASSRPEDPMVWAPRELDKLIDNPAQALDVFDFEPAARKNLPPAHFGYLASGVDDEVTLRLNREAFQHFQLRPRRLVDVSRVDMRTTILGATYDSPIVICPTGSNKAFHPDGELAVARAAKAGNHLQMLSTVATTSIEDAIAARDGPVWFQLYPTTRWEIAEALAKRAERAGSPAIVVTVDVLAPQNWETLFRMRRADDRACAECHGRTFQQSVARKPNFDGLDLTGAEFFATNLTWTFVRRLREVVRTRIVLKGIMTGEDAVAAADVGVDAIIVSNHGGRVDDGGRASIDALPVVITAVNGRIPVLVDSGFRRGTDIVKALAIGAAAVGVGRPYLWGLGAFGQAGVERVLQILRREAEAAMRQIGAPSLKELSPAMVRRA